MKKLNVEIKKYFNKNTQTKEGINKNQDEQKILEIIPTKIKKVIKEIEIKK